MKSLSILVLLFIISTFQYSYASVASFRRTEAGSCTNCLASNSSARRPQGLSSLAEQVQSIAYYTDNGDRQALAALRAKNPSSLTMEEKAILEASNRIGYLHLPGCKGANNAILININGRDAIVATAHTMLDTKTNTLKCSADEDAFYYPNASYLNLREETPSEDSFIMRTIKLEKNPVNFENVGNVGSDSTKDFLIFYLTENISQETLPSGAYNAGQTRGAMPISTVRERTGSTYNMGFDSRFDEEFGRQMGYQECDYSQNTRRLGYFKHTCDVSQGASGSLLGTIENGQMTLQAIHSSGAAEFNSPIPEGPASWNNGVSSDLFLRALPQN